MPGQLRVTGSLSLDQFWPAGMSDADTTTLKLTVSTDSFEFREHASLPWRKQPQFATAKVKGKQGSRAVVDPQGRVKVRLQGIDAPELHYRPTLPSRKDRPEITDAQRAEFKNWNEDYRQHLAESATQALHTKLSTFGGPDVAVEAVSYVDEPNDVFDIYGRMVGNVIVSSSLLDINGWLMENGWVMPAYYNSMSATEIEGLNALWDSGWRLAGRVWDKFQYKIPAFDPAVRFRKTGGPDAGPLTLPKIFRRQALWWAMKKAGIFGGTLVQYLKKNVEQVQLTDELLDQGTSAAPWYELTDFITANGTLEFDPEFIIFKEGASTLLDAGGQKITAWQ